MGYSSMTVNNLKAELRKRSAKLSGTKEQLVKRLVFLLFWNTIYWQKYAYLPILHRFFFIYRLLDYNRNNNFVGTNEVFHLQDDLVLSGLQIVHSSVTSKIQSPDFDVVNISTYLFRGLQRQYRDDRVCCRSQERL